VWRRVLVAFACAQAVALCVPPAALATTSAFTSGGINDGPLNNASPIADGDWIAVGFTMSDHNHSNAATTLYLQGTSASVPASATLALTCTVQGSTPNSHLSIPIPAGPYFYPADYTANGAWWPTGAAQSSLTYQTSVRFASPCANRGPAYIVNNGEQYSGTLASSNNTTDLFHIQLHTAIPAANKQSNVNCADTSQNPGGGVPACNFAWNWKPDNLTPAAYAQPSPTPSPTPTATPAPTPQPTASPSPSSSPTASPSPSSDPGSSSGSAGSGGPGGSGGSGSAAAGESTGGSSGGAAAPTPHFYPTSVLGAHSSAAAFSSSLQGAGAGGPASTQPARSSGALGSSAQYRPVPVTSVPPAIRVGPLLPVPVVSPVIATGSLLEHLPMQWYALLAAVDCVLVLAIIARRNRAKSLAMTTQGKP
jgi:uncharacterized membrane protein YgcG